MKKRTFICLASLILLSTSISSFAKFSISPSVGIKETYTDNLFLSETDREDDLITTINPALSLTYSPFSSLDLSLNYGLNFRFYVNHSELNDTSLSETQNVRFTTQFRPFNRVFIDVSDVYQRVPVDERENFVIDNPVENMTDSNVFRISPYVKIPITSTVTTQFGYSYRNVWYDEEQSNNSEGHSAFFTLSKQFPFPLTSSVNYDYLIQEAENSSDYERHQWSVDARYQVSKNLLVWAQGGIAYFDFEGSSSSVVVADPLTGIPVRAVAIQEENTEEEPLWSAGADYHMKMFGGSDVGVSYSESFTDPATSQEIWREDIRGYIALYSIETQERTTLDYIPTGEYVYTGTSTTTGVQKVKRADLYVTAGTDFRVTINPFYSVHETVEETNYVRAVPGEILDSKREDTIKGVTVSIAKPMNIFGRVSTLTADSTYQRERFEDENRIGVEKNERYAVGFGISYQVSRNINTSAGYRYSKKDSSFEGNSFYSNIAWIQARITF